MRRPGKMFFSCFSLFFSSRIVVFGGIFLEEGVFKRLSFWGKESPSSFLFSPTAFRFLNSRFLEKSQKGKFFEQGSDYIWPQYFYFLHTHILRTNNPPDFVAKACQPLLGGRGGLYSLKGKNTLTV